jgi:hypothetical protein
MGIVAKAFGRLTLSLGCGVRAESRLFARGTGDRGRCGAVASISGQERSAFQIGEIDRQRGGGAGIAVRRAETEHDDGGREWEGHEVSQKNGCGLQERGTTAIRRMVPPQSRQMTKSAAVSGQSPRV